MTRAEAEAAAKAAADYRARLIASSQQASPRLAAAKARTSP